MGPEEVSCFKGLSRKKKKNTQGRHFWLLIFSLVLGGCIKCLGSLLPLDGRMKIFIPSKVKSNGTPYLMRPVFLNEIAFVGRTQNFTRLFSSSVALNIWLWCTGGMMPTRENRRTLGKTLPHEILSAKNPTWIDRAQIRAAATRVED